MSQWAPSCSTQGVGGTGCSGTGGNGTDTNGNYSIIVPPGSNYYAQVNNTPTGWLGQQFYSNATDAASARMFAALTNAAATNINFNLHHGATISGQVFAGGKVLPNAWVEADIVVPNEGWQWEDSQEHGSGWNVHPDRSARLDCIVHAQGPYRSVWVEQYYDHVGDQQDATLLTVTLGQATTNINFDLPQGAIVSGCVRGDDGTPIQNANVQVGTMYNFRRRPVLAAKLLQQWYGFQRQLLRDRPVRHQLLRAGQSALWIHWQSQFYSNATDAASATMFAALTNASATNINFYLPRGAIVSGCVRGDDGKPIQNANVQVWTSDWRRATGGNSTDSNGNYSVTVPPGTNYYAEAYPPYGSIGLSQFYSNATDEASATMFAALTNASATNINFHLPRGAIDWWLRAGRGWNGDSECQCSGVDIGLPAAVLGKYGFQRQLLRDRAARHQLSRRGISAQSIAGPILQQRHGCGQRHNVCGPD